jgi:squalene synthase HpnC
MFLALGATIRARTLPVRLFEDLLSAFRQDITTHRYATWDAVLSYCQRSANPVGRLVLRIAGYDDPALDKASDAICTALQLTNFWQDLERDWQKGRLYVPQDDREVCRASEQDLSARRMTEEWRCALACVAKRTRALFDAGRPVCDRVSGRLRLELRLTWLGGMRILDRLETSGYNVFDARPSLGVRDAPSLLWNALTWRSG